jgi:hypothetical protein
LNYLDWGLKISDANPNFNAAVFPNASLPRDAHDYNYNIGYLADPSGELASNGHLSDIGKLPNHPTFSNESVYGIGNPNVGRWVEPMSGDDWRYHNPSRGLFMAPEAEAYKHREISRLTPLFKQGPPTPSPYTELPRGY